MTRIRHELDKQAQRTEGTMSRFKPKYVSKTLASKRNSEYDESNSEMKRGTAEWLCRPFSLFLIKIIE